MGLELKANHISRPENFCGSIEAKIDKGIPVILFLQRQTLVYDLGDNDSTHGVIVSGYHSRIPKMLLRDAPHVEHSGAEYQGHGYGLFKLWMRKDIVQEMWERSHVLPDNIDHVNKMYTVEKSGKSVINSYQDLLHDIHGVV